jgi:hypothetical protein
MVVGLTNLENSKINFDISFRKTNPTFFSSKKKKFKVQTDTFF